MTIQGAVLLITLILMGVIILVFWRAARAASQPSGATADESTRSRLILGMLVVGVVVSIASLVRWPHAISAGTGPGATVNVTGAMWYWEIDRQSVPLGVPVVFNAHTSDVTHGFGVTDPDGALLFQTQAMPGYVNQVEHVFSKPGVYKVVCLEYCGLAHHAMVSQFTVAAAN